MAEGDTKLEKVLPHITSQFLPVVCLGEYRAGVIRSKSRAELERWLDMLEQSRAVLRVDRHGNIWVSDSFLNVIFKLNPNGDVIKVFGVRGENGPWDDTKWNGMFNQPLDITWDKDDNFYVVQGHGGILVIEVPNEFQIALDDPTNGRMVYEAKIGIMSDEKAK